jgi:hypothetical protein
MSRSGYTDDYGDEDPLALGRWRGAVRSSLRGKRGQTVLRELLAVLDAMPEKRLYGGNFATPEGEFCTLGVLGAARGIKMDDLGDEEYCDARDVAERFGIAHAMAAEIMHLNDEHIDDETWIEVEFCGPVRPHYPDWGRHTRSVRVPVKDAPERRWRYMRDWVAKNLESANGG